MHIIQMTQYLIVKYAQIFFWFFIILEHYTIFTFFFQISLDNQRKCVIF